MSEYFHWQEYGDRQPFEDLDEAVEDYLENFVDPAGWPETVEIYGFCTKRIPRDDTAWVHRKAVAVAEYFWEWLDEEYGNSDERADLPNPVYTLAEQFILAAAAHFDDHNIWPDDTSETINVQEWVKANHPDWLTESTPTIPDVVPQKETP